MSYKNKKFFITGGTGSLGKALIKRLQSLGAEIIVYSRDEGKQALCFNSGENVKKIIGDIRDFDKLNTSLKIHQPDYIIHAAALKRIDDGSYGYCVNTGEPIGIERLLVRPTALFCAEEKNRQEKIEKAYRD